MDINTVGLRADYSRPGSSVLDAGALSYFDNVAVWVADVAARLAVLGDRWSEELGAAALP